MTPKGFRFAGVRCGLKNKRNDLGILLSTSPCVATGVFTQNRVRAACVDLTSGILNSGAVRGVVVNSGNANCCTGDLGRQNTLLMADEAETALGVEVGTLCVASTGVIGKQLDMAKVRVGIQAASQALGDDPGGFAEAILTTDLVEKSHAVRVGDGVVYGVAKGSGMLAPNMATMLAFIATDLEVAPAVLTEVFAGVAARTFNRVTVDGDTSTNDMALCFANGLSGFAAPTKALENALFEVCDSLARQIARDGEGATKMVEVVVRGSADPLKVARTIAESPITKAAMFGCDPNWGRIMAAAGRSGVEFDVAKAKLTLDASGLSTVLFDAGSPTEFDVKAVSAALKTDHVVIDLFLGEGEEARMYTCDFGYGYVRINAEYHT